MRYFKKLAVLVSMVMVLSMSTVLAGGNPNWSVIAITSASYVAVTLPEGATCGSISMYTEDAASVLFAKDSSGTDERVALDGVAAEGWNDICPAYGSEKVVMYVKGTSSTNLILLYRNN